MKILFDVKDRDLFLKGENCNRPVKLDVNAEILPDRQRKLIYGHTHPQLVESLVDGDFYCVVYDPEKAVQGVTVPVGESSWGELVVAEEQTLDSLCLALEQYDCAHRSFHQDTLHLQDEMADRGQKMAGQYDLRAS